MYRGYNCIGSDIRDMLSNPGYRSVLGQHWAGTDTVLRFPDGQEDINKLYPIYPQDVTNFISWMKAFGLNKVVLRACFYDIQGSIDAYKKFQTNGIEVLYVESSNEPWFAPNNNPKNNYEKNLLLKQKWFGWFPLVGQCYENLKAQQYATETINLYQQFRAQIPDILDKFAFTCPLPIDVEKNEWWNVLSNVLREFKIVSFHIYGVDGPDTNWDFYDERIKTQVGNKFRKICTEGNGFHFGDGGWSKYVKQAFKEPHRQAHNRLIKLCTDNNFEILQIHNGFGFDDRRMFPMTIINEDSSLLVRTGQGWN